MTCKQRPLFVLLNVSSDDRIVLIKSSIHSDEAEKTASYRILLVNALDRIQAAIGQINRMDISIWYKIEHLPFFSPIGLHSGLYHAYQIL